MNPNSKESFEPTVSMPMRVVGNGYPTSDGKPMAETDLHRRLMTELIMTLQAF